MSEHEFVCSFDEQLAMAKSELISAITRYREKSCSPKTIYYQ
ncbi:hypothetical protein D028_3133 [Vibrio parahaemolyticus 50]|nr:hypothetical protein D028_3133 [Vibrio parahaemolyticus 50]EVT94929.1 hypothetical protein D018_3188 [Vibrio parahaemolyticus VP2007-007]